MNIIIFFICFYSFADNVTDFKGNIYELNEKTPFMGEKSVVQTLEKVQSSLYDLSKNEQLENFRKMEDARINHLSPLFNSVKKIKALHSEAMDLIQDSQHFLKSQYNLRGPFLDRELRFSLKDVIEFSDQVNKAFDSIPDGPSHKEEIDKLNRLRSVISLMRQYIENFPFSINRAVSDINSKLSSKKRIDSKKQFKGICLEPMAVLSE